MSNLNREIPHADLEADQESMASILDTNHLKWYRSFVFRFALIFALIFSVVILSLITGQHYFKRKEVARRFGQTLQTIVQNYAPSISGDDLQAIQKKGDEQLEEFKQIQAQLSNIRALNHLDEDLIYILKPTQGEQWVFQVMLQEETFIGDLYTPPLKLKRAYREALAGNSAYSKIFQDDHGSFISGVAPIRDSKGNIVALLEADFRLQTYLEHIRQSLIADLATAFGSMILIILVGIWMYKRLSYMISTLLIGTNAIERQEYDYRIAVKGSDELSILARALNKALARLKERGEMMRFLPMHTQEMIQRVLRGGERKVHLSEARELDVVVFESDIRGLYSVE